MSISDDKQAIFVLKEAQTGMVYDEIQAAYIGLLLH